MALVRDLMSPMMVRRTSEDPILEISKTMVNWKISSVVITDDKDNKHIVGVVTERDLVKGIAMGIDPATTLKESALMSTPVFSIRSDQPVEEAARTMISYKVRHLFVEDNGKGISGIITTTDLAKYLQSLQNQSIGESGHQQEPYSKLLSEVWELYF